MKIIYFNDFDESSGLMRLWAVRLKLMVSPGNFPGSAAVRLYVQESHVEFEIDWVWKSAEYFS